MQLIVKTKKVSEMTTIELKNLIRDTLFEVIDPDYGLELRTEVEKELGESRKQKRSGKGVSLKDAKKHLGLHNVSSHFSSKRAGRPIKA